MPPFKSPTHHRIDKNNFLLKVDKRGVQNLPSHLVAECLFFLFPRLHEISKCSKIKNY